MTATLERWWTPAGRIRAEDMLRPGSDPQKDLGLALFALHRGGAEACELVAKTAVADEFVLAAALAETRALLAPLAVETIAKAVDGPQYAGLLLKDVLDDAEVAAVALYRTCLAKSVAPPIAAQRVGMVFGVPSRELSRYAQLASDPKANPTAVQDMADRTLFGFVSKVVNEEYVQAKETFAKAPVDVRDPGEGGDYLEAHNVEHGPRGRFVREGQREVLPGTSLQDLFDRSEQRLEAPEVATPPKTTTTGPAVGRTAQRARRMQRQARPTDKPALSRQQLQAQQLQARRLGTQQLSAKGLALQALVAHEPTPMPLSGMPRSVPNLSTYVIGDRDLSRTLIDKPISFVLSDAEYTAVARAAGDSQRGNHVLRLGPLEEYAGKARLYEDQGMAHEDHKAGVEHVLSVVGDQIAAKGVNNVVVRPVPAHYDLTGEKAEEELYQAKLAFLRTIKAEEKLQFTEAAEIGNVEHAPLMSDPTQMVLIWRPPPTDPVRRGEVYVRAPAVVELVVRPNAARGKVTGNKVDVDPSTPLRMQSLFQRHPSGDLRRTFWDADLQALRTTVVLEAASEDELDNARWTHRKADEGYLEEHNVTHGPGGRFVRDRDVPDLQGLFDQSEIKHATPTEQAPPAPAAPRRMARMQRQRRAQRPAARTAEQAPLTQAPLSSQRLGAQRLSREQLARHMVGRQSVRERTDPYKDLVWFDDDTIYTAIDPFTITKFVPRGFPEDAKDPVHLDWALRHVVMSKGAVQGSAGEMEIDRNAQQAWAMQVRRDQHGNVIRKNEERVLSQAFYHRDHLQDVAEHLNDLVRSNPSISMYRATMNKLADGGIHIEVFRNIDALPAQHLLRYSESASKDDPHTLIPEAGTKRLQNAHSYESWLIQGLDSMTAMGGRPLEITIANPKVKTWLVE